MAIFYSFHDSQYTTIFTQLGARTMPAINGHDRWIGNLGFGQRWYPSATEEDSGNWMFGYNAFFDYDLSRSHQRIGLGVELKYDWLAFSSNFYMPLSDWKDSEDYDSSLIQERAAKGFDLRLRGYMPFYRNIAIDAAYTQWLGSNVGVFSTDDLSMDPAVWSYRIEYAPIPLASAFFGQQSSNGETETAFGLNLTYHLDIPPAEHLSHTKVAELRSVDGSRHEFVNRENRIILEYRDKPRPLSLTVTYNRDNFVIADFSATATITATAEDSDGRNIPINPGDVTWIIESSSISLPAWQQSRGAMNGLAWGEMPVAANLELNRRTVDGTAPTGPVAMLTDIVGSRTVQLKAIVLVAGQTREESVTLDFGPGPLSVFTSFHKSRIDRGGTGDSWITAVQGCGGSYNTAIMYQRSTNLPSHDQIRNVMKYRASSAAGWAMMNRIYVGELSSTTQTYTIRNDGERNLSPQLITQETPDVYACIAPL
jgi:hypothetical protein